MECIQIYLLCVYTHNQPVTHASHMTAKGYTISIFLSLSFDSIPIWVLQRKFHKIDYASKNKTVLSLSQNRQHKARSQS